LGFRLSTYATLVIRRAIEQAADPRSFPCRSMSEGRFGRFVDSQQVLRQRLSREPLLSEIAAEVGLDCRRVDELLNYEQQPISLETAMGEDAERRRRASRGQHELAYPEATIAERMQREEVRSALDSLDDRLRLVLQLRFGLAGQPPRSLVEVGRELGVTHERARQLEARALDKLRNLAPDLRGYLEVA
jgi:RNA polymerase sigma factor (sigma-70 family)